MLSPRTVRRLCAAFDTVVLTAIAASLSKPRTKSKSDLAPLAGFPVSPLPLEPASHLTSAAVNSTESAIPPLPSGSHAIPDQRPDPESNSEPALVALKKERDPEKLFRLFQSSAQNRLVIEIRFAFQDTVSHLAGARRFDLLEQ